MKLPNEKTVNKNRSLWAGKRIGDRVEYRSHAGTIALHGDIVNLSLEDPNIVLLLWDDAVDPVKHFASWLTITQKIEDRNDYQPIRLLESGSYIFGQSNTAGASGQIGKVTKLLIHGIVIYTRETVNAVDSFLVGSGERWGDKTGKRPGKRRQALELCAPDDHWEAIATIVRQVDTLHRPVLTNTRFTIQWAKTALTGVKATHV